MRCEEEKKRKKSIRAVTQNGTEKPCVDGWWERREGTEFAREKGERAIDL